MTTYYLKSGAGAIVYAQQAYVTGNKIVPTRTDVSSNVALARGWVWECTTAGTTNGAITWPASVTQDVTTVTQNSVVFTARKPGFSSGSTANWAFATIYLDYLAQASGPLAANDIIYASNNHAEVVAYSGNLALIWPTLAYLECVNDGAAPPVAGVTSPTATFTWSNSAGGNLDFVGSGEVYVSGCAFIWGSNIGSDQPFRFFGGSFENCSFEMLTANSGSVWYLCSAAGQWTRFTGCTFKNTNANHQFVNAFGSSTFIGGGLVAGGTYTGELFSAITSSVSLIGFDFSAASSTAILFHEATFQFVVSDCKLPASWTGTPQGNQVVPPSRTSLYNCDSGNTNYKLYIYAYSGTINDETTLVRTTPAGASDGTTTLSWKMAAGVQASYKHPLYTDWFSLGWDDTPGAKTATIDILHDSLTALTNADVWLEIAYLGTSGIPLALLASNKVVTGTTPANQTTSTATWTTTGMTNPNKQKLTKTFTTTLKGVVLGRVALAKTSYTVYVDPPNSNTPALA